MVTHERGLHAGLPSYRRRRVTYLDFLDLFQRLLQDRISRGLVESSLHTQCHRVSTGSGISLINIIIITHAVLLLKL